MQVIYKLEKIELTRSFTVVYGGSGSFGKKSSYPFRYYAEISKNKNNIVLFFSYILQYYGIMAEPLIKIGQKRKKL